MNKMTFATVAALAAMALLGCQKKAPTTTELEVPPMPAAELAPEPGQPDMTETAVEEAPVQPAGTDTTGAPAPSAGQEQAARTYTVRKGDTLYSIARKFYGDQRRHKDIVKANNLTDPNKIFPGQVLKIPD